MNKNEINAVKLLWSLYYEEQYNAMYALQKEVYRQVLIQYQEYCTKKYKRYDVFSPESIFEKENTYLGYVDEIILDPHFAPYPSVQVGSGWKRRCYNIGVVNICK